MESGCFERFEYEREEINDFFKIRMSNVFIHNRNGKGKYAE